MSDDKSRKRLGRGLAALIGEMDAPVSKETSTPQREDRRVPIEEIGRSENNPRRQFSEDELEELSASIREHGIIQPIVVRPITPNDQGEKYEIIAGERRWRAAQRAAQVDVPIIIRDVDDRVALELAIVENVQRSDLNAVEEALGYEQLLHEHDYTQNDLANVIGKSRSHVANTLRLLKLPDDVRAMVAEGALSAGHARTLVTAPNPSQIATRIIREGLSVRQAEALATEPASNSGGRSGGGVSEVEKDADTAALERTLSDALGFKVQIAHKDPGGKVTVHYKSLDQLDEICHRLQGS
ncbi:MAG: ParB/RepB/Spo0J family partition protein [Pseudomonadota bacterium]